jgi:hypothetical protein
VIALPHKELKSSLDDLAFCSLSLSHDEAALNER